LHLRWTVLSSLSSLIYLYFFEGRICLDILKDKWSPALQVRTVLLSIQALLSAPNPEDPLDTGVADAWKANEALAMAEARKWTGLYAVREP